MLKKTDFRHLELIVDHCKTVYNASCTDEALAKGRLMNWIDFRGNVTSAGHDLASLMENFPLIYRQAYNLQFE